QPSIVDAGTQKPERSQRMPGTSNLRDFAASADFAFNHAVPGEIEFRNLTFAYGDPSADSGSPRAESRGDRPVLRGISAKIEAGQTVALVGPTGSGKSTLIALLARLHDPPPGTVFVDGVDVRDMPLAVLRNAIGFVPQEP